MPERNEGSPGKKPIMIAAILLLAVVMCAGLVSLGALASVMIAGFTFQGQHSEARIQVASIHLMQLDSYIEMHYIKNGALPSSLEELAPLMPSEGLPLDPWGGAFQYSQQPSCGRQFSLSSMGPDGLSATADDITLCE